MARFLLLALQKAGFAPQLASELRTLDKQGNRAEQEAIRAESEREAADLIALYRALAPRERPRAWFTYHVYYKAPDWIGPRIADALRIPYVVAEGSRASKRASGPWALGHEGAEAALDHADVLFAMTANDREVLERRVPHHQRILDLPPFLDVSPFPILRPRDLAQTPRLLTVGMMREGDKLSSYRLLAEALSLLADKPWTLDIVGDGPARESVETLFAPFGSRIFFRGAVSERERLAALYAQAHLFVWPAVNEAYGMALLEAQAAGCPVVAGAFGGVPNVVRHGETGWLVEPGNSKALAEATEKLLASPENLTRMGAQAFRFVGEERGLEGAAKRLRDGIMPMLARSTA